MRSDLYWIPAETEGRVAIMPRPRGGDWLEDEIAGWRRAGVNIVLSLLTSDEIADLELADEERLCNVNGIHFISFPIIDRSVPSSKEAFTELISDLEKQLHDGKSIAIHCRQGIGRAALVAICLFVSGGMNPETAIQRVSTARHCTVPETVEQQRWITQFAQLRFSSTS